MKILPVIDLKNGLVVRGQAGQRDMYRPVNSRLTRKTDSLSVARAFRNEFGLAELYLADLDAIECERPHLEIYRALAGDGFQLLIDAGLRTVEQACRVHETGAHTVIAPLETIPGPNLLAELLNKLPPGRVVFSLDLKNKTPLGNLQRWSTPDPFGIAREAIAAGIERILVLDLAGVGTNNGVCTDDLCARIRAAFPDVEIITGGGVRGADDLARLARLGIDGVLVASALHDGRLTKADLEQPV